MEFLLVLLGFQFGTAAGILFMLWMVARVKWIDVTVRMRPDDEAE